MAEKQLKDRLIERLTVRVNGEHIVALKAYMSDEGMENEGEVLRMALTQFLRKKGYLPARDIPVNSGDDSDDLANAKQKADKKCLQLEQSGKKKIKDSSGEK